MNQSEIVSTCGFTDKEVQYLTRSGAIAACKREMSIRHGHTHEGVLSRIKCVWNLYAPELPAFLSMVVFIGVFSLAMLAL
jgi:hypothetical protein